MKSTMREIVSLCCGAAGLGATAAIGTPVVLMVSVPVLMYFGARTLLHVDSPSNKILPNGDLNPEEIEKYISSCSLKIDEIKDTLKSINKEEFLKSLTEFCNVIERLLKHFQENPQKIKVAIVLPERLEKFLDLLKEYIKLSKNHDISEYVSESLNTTEKTVSSAIERFFELYKTLLENDAIKLTTKARTMDTLLSLD